MGTLGAASSVSAPPPVTLSREGLPGLGGPAFAVQSEQPLESLAKFCAAWRIPDTLQGRSTSLLGSPPVFASLLTTVNRYCQFRVCCRRDNQLLISLANGNLVALDQETGETLWTFETGAPLVSSTPPSTDDTAPDSGEEPESGEGAASRPKDSIFPGTDGSLYAYRQAHGDEPPRIEVRLVGRPSPHLAALDCPGSLLLPLCLPLLTSPPLCGTSPCRAARIPHFHLTSFSGLLFQPQAPPPPPLDNTSACRPGPATVTPAQKLPVTVSELVNQSPAPTLDGSLMMGSQHTTVFLIDGASGDLIRTFYDFDGELAQLRSMDTAALGACWACCAVLLVWRGASGGGCGCAVCCRPRLGVPLDVRAVGKGWAGVCTH